MADELTWDEKARIGQNEKQEMYHRWKVFDKEQDGFMKTDIGIFLFGPVDLPKGDTPPPLDRYHEHYCQAKQKTIENIVTQIRKKMPPPRHVAFGCTFLTARVDGCEGIQEFVVFRCATETQSDVFFVEPSGRVYRDWRDFVDSNKLPSCTYLAPDDGIYKLEGPIFLYTSPEAKKGFVRRNVDRMVTVAGVGVVGASALSIAPVTAAVAGAVVCGYSTYQSVANLYDRYDHWESIKPDNVEAISNHLTIATAGLTGVSSAALACRQRIVERCGKWAPTLLRTMNIGVLSLDAFGLAFNSYVFYGKWGTGELTFMDTFNLALQVYMLHGQLSNTIEMHRILSSSGSAAPPRLTKSQKRNLRRRRAKAAKKGLQLSPNAVRVTKASDNSFTSIKLIARCLGSNTVAFLRKHFPREQVIIEFLTDVKQLVSNLWEGEISCRDFLLNLEVHVRNLAQILRDDIDSLRRYSSSLGVEPDVNAVGAAFNGIQRVNDSEDGISEKLDRMAEQIPGGLHDPSAPEPDLLDSESATEPVANDDGIMKRIDVESILNAVQRLIGKCVVEQTSAMLLVFAEGVKYVRNVLVTELVEKYELAFSVNMSVLNDSEKVAEILTVLGAKSGDHFFPVRADLEAKLLEAAENVEQFVEVAEYAIGIRDEKDLHADRINVVAARISTAVAEIIGLLAPAETGMGLQQTLDMLEYVTKCVTENTDEFDQRQTVANQLLQANVAILGRAKADQILEKMGLSVDPVTIALKCVKTELDDAQLEHLLKYSSCVPPPEPGAEDGAIDSSANVEDANLEDDFLISLTMYTCSVFMKKIKPLDDATNDPQKLLQKVLQFVLTRFARDTSDSIDQFQELESNLDILGPVRYKKLLTKLKACPQKNKGTLQRTSELLMACGDDLVSEYFELFETDDQLENVQLWQSSADEEGLQVKSTKNCCIDLSDLEFRDLAISLFHVYIDTNFSVEKRKNSVCLKSTAYIVSFSLDEESGSWLVILADKRVNENEE